MSPGTLRLIRATGNPHGADDNQLFLFVGNPTLAPVNKIIPDEGVMLPPPREDLSSYPCRLKILHINDMNGPIVCF